MLVQTKHNPGHWTRRAVLIILTALALGVACCLLLPFLFERYYHRPVNASSVVSVESGPLVVEIWVSDRCPAVGETVTVRATVTNEGSRNFIIELTDQPVLDVILTDADGQHRWSDGKLLTSQLTRLELKPGESRSIQMRWITKRNYVGVYARFISTVQSVEHPVSPSMVVGDCSGLIGP